MGGEGGGVGSSSLHKIIYGRRFVDSGGTNNLRDRMSHPDTKVDALTNSNIRGELFDLFGNDYDLSLFDNLSPQDKRSLCSIILLGEIGIDSDRRSAMGVGELEILKSMYSKLNSFKKKGDVPRQEFRKDQMLVLDQLSSYFNVRKSLFAALAGTLNMEQLFKPQQKKRFENLIKFASRDESFVPAI